MNKYMMTNPAVHIAAMNTCGHLREAIRETSRLEAEVTKANVSLSDERRPNFRAWLSCLSFMTRKIEALYLGQTDYDFEYNDIKFQLLQKKD